MTFRSTTLERAYELAREGRCRTVGDIKIQLKLEGYERIRESLYGGTLNAALRDLCREHYAPAEGQVEP
ncbi:MULTISPECIES: hypothetical protein [unclassified Brevundimonas]|jgi:hypothetical protein|uniref:hypothetical protein n=1 Tax=unclassified Brevundimonas TaxID=2622653 RepID=UPI000C3DE26C|nr:MULTISPECIES: hypothetical protein [unclassified Brevundimonas]MAL88083.1 hypothetical protein [Brevundimonas sp.]HAJ03485.1 hypothetical protein [Brevundimonas sp.]HAV48924.1 hypothetical protein [Brevundimonas sp.]